ncbi:MAG: single-stranded DNA-binding protein [Brevinematales bacterium]|nr:single-stranded DNA-binding protein [Brevinematales bacterium]
MSKSLNKVILVGNLARDNDQKVSAQSGKIIVKNVIAVEDKKAKKTYYFDVVFWDKIGEIISRYTKKGSKILVEGRLIQSSWETKETDKNGKPLKRSKVEVVAENIILLSPKQQEISSQPNQISEHENDDISSKEVENYDDIEYSKGEDYYEGEEFENLGNDEVFNVEESTSYSQLDENEDIKDINTKNEL